MDIILKNLFTALRRYPTAFLLNLAGLSVAFGAFLVILIQVGYEYGYNRTVPQAEKVFRVSQFFMGKYCAVLDQPLIEELTASSAHIEAASLLASDPELSGDVRVLRANGSQDYFHSEVLQVASPMVDVLGIELTEGDASGLEGDERVLIPLSLARKVFADESAVGKQLLLSEVNASYDGYRRETPLTSLTVGGVYRDFPRNSTFPNAILRGHPWKDLPGNANYHFYVRLDDAKALPDVRAAMNEVCRAYFRRHDLGLEDVDAVYETAGDVIRLTGVRDLYFENDVAYASVFASKTDAQGDRTVTGILLSIAVLVILIASINFINFASALAPVRMKMINLQKIMGAGVGSLRASLLAESTVIALGAYLIAVCLVAVLSGTSFAQYVTADLSPARNAPLVLRCALLAAGVGVAAGLYPACYLTSFRPVLSVRGSFGATASGRRYRMALVGMQYVISLILIIAALFVHLQNRHITRFDAGYDKEQVVVVKLPADAWRRYDTLAAQLRTRAAVEDVAFAFSPFAAADAGYSGWSRKLPDDGQNAIFSRLIVSDNFLRALGIRVAEGRDFRASDALRAPCSYIFNNVARRRFNLKTGDYLDRDEGGAEGNRSPGWGEVVGFLPQDVQLFSLRREEEPFAFVVFGSQGWRDQTAHCYVRLRAGVDKIAAVELIRRDVKDFTPYDFEVRFQDAAVQALYQSERKTGVLVTSFSVLAILVSLMGVFGLVLFETQYRRKEIGIRKVHGASSASVLRMFNRRFVAIVGVSFLVAAPVAWYGTGVWLRGFRSVVPMYTWVFAAALAIVACVTVLTVTLRTWRTARENPVESLKTE